MANTLREPHTARVECPSCGAWAQLRYIVRNGEQVEAIGISCPNQTARTHESPTLRQLDQLAAQLRVL
jgi:hypothetical protein